MTPEWKCRLKSRSTCQSCFITSPKQIINSNATAPVILIDYHSLFKVTDNLKEFFLSNPLYRLGQTSSWQGHFWFEVGGYHWKGIPLSSHRGSRIKAKLYPIFLCAFSQRWYFLVFYSDWEEASY